MMDGPLTVEAIMRHGMTVCGDREVGGKLLPHDGSAVGEIEVLALGSPAPAP
jgi:hypothetical protein